MKARLLTISLLALLSAPVAAQDGPVSPTNGEDSEVIDILVPVPSLDEEDRRAREACENRQDSPTIDGEILVCAGAQDSPAFFYSGSREAAEDRYARETAFAGAPRTPDPCGPNCGIFTGPATVTGLCGFGLNPCPPPPAYIVDFDALPDAPAGSDADRIANGLEPSAEESSEPRRLSEFEKKELGLPPLPDFAVEEDTLSLRAPAAPAAER